MLRIRTVWLGLVVQGLQDQGAQGGKTHDSLFSTFSISTTHLHHFSQYSFCPSVTKPARLHKIQSQEANLKWCREFEMLQRIWNAAENLKNAIFNLILNIRTYQTKARLIIDAFMTSRMTQFCWTWRLRCWQGRRSSGIRSPRSASKDKPPKLPPRDNSIYGPNHIPKVQHLPSIMTHLNVGLRQQRINKKCTTRMWSPKIFIIYIKPYNSDGITVDKNHAFKKDLWRVLQKELEPGVTNVIVWPELASMGRLIRSGAACKCGCRHRSHPSQMLGNVTNRWTLTAFYTLDYQD